MNREQKSLLIKELSNNFENAEATFLVDYQGLTVAQMQTLRRGLRSKGGQLKIAKNRLVKRAISEVDVVCKELPDYLKKQLGMVFAGKDFTEVAKVLSDFSKENEALSLVVGCLDAQLIDAEKIAKLASLPSKEVLLGKVCGTLQAPIAAVPRVLNSLVLKMLYALKQVEQTKK